MNDAVIIIPPPVIITNGSESHGPVPLWLWIFLGVCVAATFLFLGWAIWDDRKWRRKWRR